MGDKQHWTQTPAGREKMRQAMLNRHASKAREMQVAAIKARKENRLKLAKATHAHRVIEKALAARPTHSNGSVRQSEPDASVVVTHHGWTVTINPDGVGIRRTE